MLPLKNMFIASANFLQSAFHVVLFSPDNNRLHTPPPPFRFIHTSKFLNLHHSEMIHITLTATSDSRCKPHSLTVVTAQCMNVAVPARRTGIFFWSFTKKYCTTSAVCRTDDKSYKSLRKRKFRLLIKVTLWISVCRLPFGPPAQLWASPVLYGPVTYSAEWTSCRRRLPETQKKNTCINFSINFN